MQRGRKSAAALATFPVDGRPTLLRPPASLSEAQRAVFVATVTAVRPEHFQPCDLPLLVRYCEIVAMCDHVGKKLAADIVKNRPSPHWLMTEERLQKMLIVLCRHLRLSPLARTPHKNGRPEAVDSFGNAYAVSAYELMRLDDEPE